MCVNGGSSGVTIIIHNTDLNVNTFELAAAFCFQKWGRQARFLFNYTRTVRLFGIRHRGSALYAKICEHARRRVGKFYSTTSSWEII